MLDGGDNVARHGGDAHLGLELGDERGGHRAVGRGDRKGSALTPLTRPSATLSPPAGRGSSRESLRPAKRRMRGSWLTPALVAVAFVAITIAERKRPLRRRVEPESRRLGRNFAMAGLTAAVTAAMQKPLVDRVSQERFGAPFVRSTDAQRRQLLDEIAYTSNDDPALTQAIAFFNSFRDLTATGFFTSKMGMADLQYKGNVFVSEWTGCPDEALKKLGVSYKPG